ncbi:peptide ABC transporter substrate-binding protein [Pseudokineococcus sp. 1T1Z-3]|uniref:peptide ABC transporter substrate-binding protein n=1 Tax=Pseudokineococcus sp. 1T1Z-3 TaxID=3132745 RepID=UPI0030A2C176
MRLARCTTAAAVVAALTLTACGSGGGGAGDQEALSIAVGEPDSLTPGRQTVAFEHVTAIFAPLTGISDDSDLEYIAAESVESDDAITWTITLREGWTFQDGTPVTSQSYVDAWNYTAYAPNAWPNNGQFANVEGYEALNPLEGEPSATELSGLEVVDDTTFTVTLTAPDGQFPLQLSQGQTGFYPMPESAYDDLDAYDRAPVGNGPFQMVGTWEDDQPVFIERWEDYQGEDAEVEQVELRPYADQGTAYTDVQAGNLDILFLPADRYTVAADDFGDRLYSFDAPGISYLGLPTEFDERYADIRVRQAISLAIDREAINEVIYGGLYEPATAWTPPVEPGTPEGVCGEFCEFDPERAQELLAEAGGWEGPMEIVYPGGSGLDTLYEAYANQLRQNLGIADVVASPTTDFAEFFEVRTSGELGGPFFSRWGALYPSQQNTLRAFFTPTGGCAPCVQAVPEEIPELIAAADAEPDEQAAQQAYAAVQEAIAEDFVVPPTFFETYSFVVSERVSDLPSTAGSVDLSGVTLADA